MVLIFKNILFVYGCAGSSLLADFSLAALYGLLVAVASPVAVSSL